MKLLPLTLAILPLGALFSLAQTAEKPTSRLDELPRPWTEPIHRISFEEYDATLKLKYWAAQRPGLFTLQKRGESHHGQPFYLVKITDASVPDEDKRVALLPACSYANCGVRKDSPNMGEAMHGGAQRPCDFARTKRRGADSRVYLCRIIRENPTV